MSSKSRKTVLLAILSLFILFFSSCGFNDVKNFGLGLLYGTPIKEQETAVDNETIPLVKNTTNSCLIDGEFTPADLLYTVKKSYLINQLSDTDTI